MGLQECRHLLNPVNIGAQLPPAPPPQTVVKALVLCGVDNKNIIPTRNAMAAQVFAEDLFLDDFDSVLNIKWKDIEKAIKYSAETGPVEGRIFTYPKVENKIKALYQWVCTCKRISINRGLYPFNITSAQNLQRLLEDFRKYDDFLTILMIMQSVSSQRR